MTGRRIPRGVAIAVDVLHETNIQAVHGVDIFVGSDNIVRINVDGICVVRVRLQKTLRRGGEVCPLTFEDIRTSAGKIEYQPDTKGRLTPQRR